MTTSSCVFPLTWGLWPRMNFRWWNETMPLNMGARRFCFPVVTYQIESSDAPSENELWLRVDELYFWWWMWWCFVVRTSFCYFVVLLVGVCGLFWRTCESVKSHVPMVFGQVCERMCHFEDFGKNVNLFSAVINNWTLRCVADGCLYVLKDDGGGSKMTVNDGATKEYSREFAFRFIVWERTGNSWVFLKINWTLIFDDNFFLMFDDDIWCFDDDFWW